MRRADEVLVHVAHPRRDDVVYWSSNKLVDARHHWLYYCGCCGYDGLLSVDEGADCKACGCVVVAVSVAKPQATLQAIASKGK